MTEKRIIGFFDNPKGYKTKKPGEHKVEIPDNLSGFSNKQLTDFYNSITGENREAFKGHYISVCTEVFKAIKKHCENPELFLQLDQKTKRVINSSAPKKKHLFESNSKLVRLARLLSLRDENGEYCVFTAAEFMEYCNGSSYCNRKDLSSRDNDKKKISKFQASQYISVLKDKNDRFFMNIVKFQTGEYQFQPNGTEKFSLLTNEELKELDIKYPDSRSEKSDQES